MNNLNEFEKFEHSENFNMWDEYDGYDETEISNEEDSIAKAMLFLDRRLNKLGLTYEYGYEIDGYKYDVKVEDNNMLIDLDKYYRYIGTFPYNIDVLYDVDDPQDANYMKYKIAVDNGFNYIRIFDWTNIDNMLNQIFKHKTIVDCKDCMFKIISNNECSDFVQKFTPEYIRIVEEDTVYGVFKNSELISCVVFRYIGEHCYCLNDIIYNTDYLIDDKMYVNIIEHFITSYDMEYLFKYIRLNSNEESYYANLGFQNLDLVLPPLLFWTSNGDFVIDTGDDTMIDDFYDAGFLPVYDCGSKGYMYILP